MSRLEQVKRDIALLKEEQKRLEVNPKRGIVVPLHDPPYDHTDKPDGYYFKIVKESWDDFWINTGYGKHVDTEIKIGANALKKIREVIDLCLEEE